MPPKVSRIVSQPTKTIAKASANSSSKSSGSSSKTSSSSSVRKSTTATSTPKPTPAQKPRNVDHVDFGEPRPTMDAGVYHRPDSRPAAATAGGVRTVATGTTALQQSQDFNGSFSEYFMYRVKAFLTAAEAVPAGKTQEIKIQGTVAKSDEIDADSSE